MSTSASIEFIDPPDVKRSPCELLFNAFLKKFVVPLYPKSACVRIEMKWWKLKWENPSTTMLVEEFNDVLKDLRPVHDDIFQGIKNTFTEHRPQWAFPNASMFVIDWLVRVSEFLRSTAPATRSGGLKQCYSLI